jgi:hypothetical protein
MFDGNLKLSTGGLDARTGSVEWQMQWDKTISYPVTIAHNVAAYSSGKTRLAIMVSNAPLGAAPVWVSPSFGMDLENPAVRPSEARSAASPLNMDGVTERNGRPCGRGGGYGGWMGATYITKPFNRIKFTGNGGAGQSIHKIFEVFPTGANKYVDAQVRAGAACGTAGDTNSCGCGVRPRVDFAGCAGKDTCDLIWDDDSTHDYSPGVHENFFCTMIPAQGWDPLINFRTFASTEKVCRGNDFWPQKFDKMPAWKVDGTRGTDVDTTKYDMRYMCAERVVDFPSSCMKLWQDQECMRYGSCPLWEQAGCANPNYLSSPSNFRWKKESYTADSLGGTGLSSIGKTDPCPVSTTTTTTAALLVPSATALVKCWHNLECPSGYTRYGDGSGCKRSMQYQGGRKNCDLGYCANSPNGNMPSCPKKEVSGQSVTILGSVSDKKHCTAAIPSGYTFRGISLAGKSLCCPKGWNAYGDGSGCTNGSERCYTFGNDLKSATPHPCPSVTAVVS